MPPCFWAEVRGDRCAPAPPPPICRNQPNIHKQALLDNPDSWHGTELSVTIAGNWPYYRAKVLKYLQQIAVITPYTQVRASVAGCVGGRACVRGLPVAASVWRQVPQ